ncbi:biotin--[acetyl-CoA-carboxylase] ligase, partial [Staphylococcus gallinarum]
EYIDASNIWNKELKFTENGNQFLGKALDIDNDGVLIVIDNDNQQHKLISADIEF